MSKNTVLGFLDECSPQTTANTRRMWSFERAPMVEKYHQDSRQHPWHSLPSMAPPPSCFRGVQAGKPGKRLIVVLDNFSSRHAVMVKAKHRQQQYPARVSPILPPGSQSHRQIWRAIKREVMTFIMNYGNSSRNCKDV
ncbi:MAG: hypothetical protein RJR34_09450 [Candidatus Methanoculleus thermohydrogenotrophicum]|nr:hypothetical protein [Candidatus Methanoculleus thermohydrogenotrophicum]